MNSSCKMTNVGDWQKPLCKPYLRPLWEKVAERSEVG
jgi:hypothetical protein